MFKKFYPKECAESSYDINYKRIYERGYRGILFDIDNTLVKHDAPADEKAIRLINDLKQMGFQICLISNNGEERVKLFNKEVKLKYIFDAGKPMVKNYNKAMKLMGTNTSNTIFVGDQLFTDIYGANRAGLRSYFVKPIGPEIEVQIKIKRKLEKIVIFFYNKQNRRNKI